MRTIVSALLLTAALPAWSAEVKRNLADEGTLTTLASQFAVAWNRHDPAAMAAFFAPGATLINPFGREAKGAAEIQKLFEEEHASVMKESILKTTSRPVQWVRPDVTVTTWDGRLTGMKSPDGKALPALTVVISSVMVKIKEGKEEKWLCAAARPMVPLPSPTPAAAK